MVRLILAVLMVSACQAPAPNLPATKLVGPPISTEISSIAWFANGQLVVGSLYQVWYRLPDGTSWQKLDTTQDPVCRGYGYFQLTALADQRLGMLCTAGVKNQGVLTTMVAYDWATQRFTPLFQGVLPDAGQFSWNPTITKAAFTPIGAYSTLYWLTSTTIQVVPVTLTKHGQSWSFAASIQALDDYKQSAGRTGRELYPVGLVRDPAWSPDGKQLVFWATLATIGKPYDFPVVPWDIYRLDPTTLQVERIFEDVIAPTTLAWSPDSTRLVYLAEPTDTQPAGMWMLSVSTRQATLLASGKYRDVAWVPDGRSLVAVKCLDDVCTSTELWSYDLRTIVTTP